MMVEAADATVGKSVDSSSTRRLTSPGSCIYLYLLYIPRHLTHLASALSVSTVTVHPRHDLILCDACWIRSVSWIWTTTASPLSSPPLARTYKGPCQGRQRLCRTTPDRPQAAVVQRRRCPHVAQRGIQCSPIAVVRDVAARRSSRAGRRATRAIRAIPHADRWRDDVRGPPQTAHAAEAIVAHDAGVHGVGAGQGHCVWRARRRLWKGASISPLSPLPVCGAVLMRVVCRRPSRRPSPSGPISSSRRSRNPSER